MNLEIGAGPLDKLGAAGIIWSGRNVTEPNWHLNAMQTASGWHLNAMQTSIRLASERDADAIAAIYRPVVESTAISFETEPPDEHEMRRRIVETLTAFPWLVLQHGSEIAGFAYASRHRDREAYRWSVDTSVYVEERFRRRGIARGLYVSLFAILSAQGFVKAFAGIALPNPASVALHERVGFTPVGVYRQAGYKLGAWRDVGWWQRPLRPADDPPPIPRGLDAIRESRDWPTLLMSGLAVVRTEPK